jgi:hypothetical protein
LLRFCQASFLAVFGIAAGLVSASAQWDPAPQPAPAASPWNAPPQQQAPAAASPWNAGPPQQQQACIEKFGLLRDDAQKRAALIRTAGERKATPKEACALFNGFSAAEAKLIKYAADNAAACGIPPEIVGSLKQQHTKTVGIQARVCQAAANPPAAAGPSLSDVLGGSAVPDANNIRTGRGTYDTLTGTPLGKQ